MLESAKELLRRVFGHWVQALAGAAMAILGLVGEIEDWKIPRDAWIGACVALFLWAILKAFHDVRLVRDQASNSLAARVNYQQIADELTRKHHYGVHHLLHTAPGRAKTQNEKAAVFEKQQLWLAAVSQWNDEVKGLMTELGCSEQEISLFWTITRLSGGMMMYGDNWERAVRLHSTRLDRLWAIIEDYAKRADTASAR